MCSARRNVRFTPESGHPRRSTFNARQVNFDYIDRDHRFVRHNACSYNPSGIYCDRAQATSQGKNMSENSTRTDGRDRETGRFLPGNSGNGGRKKGSRNKLGEQFLLDAYEEWKRSGPAALKTMAETDPGGFVRVIAAILPAKLDVTIESELFADAATFAEAFRIARQHIGAEETLQLEAIEYDAEANRA
jgi:hypothetical protein